MLAYKPVNLEEYLGLVDQTIYEADEILACADDEDATDAMEFSELLPVYEALAIELKKLHRAVKSGEHSFADGKNLAYMPLVDAWKVRIPFADILGILNDTHMKGLPNS
ncbi:MAG: hypothetical protein ACC641_05210 [Acidiferrobacterales bacterium]